MNPTITAATVPRDETVKGLGSGSHNQVGGKLGSGYNGCSMPKQIAVAFDLRDADRYPTLCIVM
jgi:hypothetical protein